jgi:hypothetical protein
MSESWIDLSANLARLIRANAPSDLADAAGNQNIIIAKLLASNPPPWQDRALDDLIYRPWKISCSTSSYASLTPTS